MKITKQELSLGILVVWLLLMFFAFWWFKLRWVNDLSAYTTDELFATETLSIPFKDDESAITLYHFFDLSCPCTRFNTQHVKEVADIYSNENVQLVVVVPTDESLKEARAAFPDAEHLVARLDFKPPASPSVLITSSHNQPEYIGPWSESAICSGGDDDDFVSAVLNELLAGQRYGFIRNYAEGCLCPWPTKKT